MNTLSFFQVKISNVCWLQPRKCEYLLLFFVTHHSKWKSLMSLRLQFFNYTQKISLRSVWAVSCFARNATTKPIMQQSGLVTTVSTLRDSSSLYSLQRFCSLTRKALHVRVPQHGAGMKWICSWKILRNAAVPIFCQFLDSCTIIYSHTIIAYSYYCSHLFSVSVRASLLISTCSQSLAPRLSEWLSCQGSYLQNACIRWRQPCDAGISLHWSFLLLLDSFPITIWKQIHTNTCTAHIKASFVQEASWDLWSASSTFSGQWQIPDWTSIPDFHH